MPISFLFVNFAPYFYRVCRKGVRHPGAAPPEKREKKYKYMTTLTNQQKKDWAKTLYLRESLTQQEIADRVGVSRVSVSNWIRAGKWEEQRTALTLTREEQVRSLYRQVANINRAIEERPEGGRYATPAEADTIGKLSKSIRQMETEVGIADVVSVITKFVDFLRPLDLEKAKEVTRLADQFIKSIL